MQTNITFAWWRERNPSDYEEIMVERPARRPRFSDVLHPERQARIVAKGVSLERYEPLERFPDLYERFANLRSQEDVINFVRRFGPLTDEGLHGGKGDCLFTALHQAGCMAAGNLHIGLVFCTLNAELVADHDGIHLKVEPTNLLDALWLQFAEAAAAGRANRCRQCKALFATGPDANRRKGAEFCSVECKTKYHSLKRSR
jgi:hypothetical protein